MVLINRTLKELASEKILEGIYNNDSSVIQYIYDKYFGSIKKFVTNHQGTEEDTWDIFQDGIIVVYEQIKNENLQLRNKFFTYFFTVCKFSWLKELRNRDKKYYEQIENSIKLEQIHLQDYKIELDEIIEKEKRTKLYQLSFQKMSKECQALLELVADGYTIQEITTELQYKSTGFTYKKRRICKERIIKMIKENTFYLNF